MESKWSSANNTRLEAPLLLEQVNSVYHIGNDSFGVPGQTTYSVTALCLKGKRQVETAESKESDLRQLQRPFMDMDIDTQRLKKIEV